MQLFSPTVSDPSLYLKRTPLDQTDFVVLVYPRIHRDEKILQATSRQGCGERQYALPQWDSIKQECEMSSLLGTAFLTCVSRLCPFFWRWHRGRNVGIAFLTTNHDQSAWKQMRRSSSTAQLFRYTCLLSLTTNPFVLELSCGLCPQVGRSEYVSVSPLLPPTLCPRTCHNRPTPF